MTSRSCYVVTLFVLSGAWATSAMAEPRIFIGSLDLTPGFESTFMLDFGGGFVENTMISDTNFTLQVDAEAGANGSAEFLSYFQIIDSINLPDPLGSPDPVPTGQITVEILPGTSSGGTYNAITGAFTTSETYRIHYTGDLSVYGLTDGFVDLPSSSSGLITFETATSGRIMQQWEGTYTFPGTTVSLAYTCRVNTQFVPEPASWMAIAFAGLFAIRRRGSLNTC